MTILGVSFLGQTTSQTNRLTDLNSELADLERQISTGKKYENFGDMGGVTAQTVQRVRVDNNAIQAYLSNITTVNNRIDQMNQAMTSAQTTTQQVVNSILSALQTSSVDVPSIITLAKSALAFVQDLANTNIDGRYLFAGSDTASAPFADGAQLDATMQTEVTNWLNGTTSTAQVKTDVDGFSGAQLGMNPALSASGSVTAQIDQSTNIDYTVRADTDGFQQIIRALGLMANLKVPNSGTDVPTTAELNDLMNKVVTMAKSGLDQMTAAQSALGTKSALISSIEDGHKKDASTLEGLISSTEGTDTTEAVTKLQALQTQLQASYNVTATLSKLSLVNFL
jgi:flagellar hook-associated protein 3 FlgL